MECHWAAKEPQTDSETISQRLAWHLRAEADILLDIVSASVVSAWFRLPGLSVRPDTKLREDLIGQSNRTQCHRRPLRAERL